LWTVVLIIDNLDIVDIVRTLAALCSCRLAAAFASEFVFKSLAMVISRRGSAVAANDHGEDTGVLHPISRGRSRRRAVVCVAVVSILFGLYSFSASAFFSSDHETDASSKQARDLFMQRWWQAQTDNALRRRELVDFHENDPLEPFEPFKTTTGINVWDLFVPTVTCPDLERVGPVGDGGKWVCALDSLSNQPVASERSCLMYSFGISNDISFEMEILRRTSCHIHAFDPTIGSLPFDNYNASLSMAAQQRITFHKLALGGHSSSSAEHLLHETMRGIMGRLGHTYVDILKVDVEGAEWKAFDGSPYLPIGQLLIELHYQGLPQLRNFFARMQANGLHPFSREINLQPAIAGGMPVAAEYSFINPKNFFSGHPLGIRIPSQVAHVAPLDKPIKAVIYFLTQRKRTKQLMGALTLLYKHSWLDYPYPVVIFHDDLELEDKRTIQASVSAMPLQFSNVDFKIPAATSMQPIPDRTACAPETSTVGYRHMCRFHANDVHRHLDAIGHHDREFIWRLDDDSSITHPIGYDVFHFMSVNRRKYGFVNLVMDDSACVEGLWANARKFAEKYSSELHNESFFETWNDPLVFYNNFEISHVSIWRDPLWVKFMDFIDTHGGIYTLRWGDAPLHTIGVSMLLSKHDIHSFSDVGYIHNPFIKQLPRGLPKPDANPFNAENCNFYGEWRCSYSNTTTNITSGANMTTSRDVLFTFSKQGHERALRKTIESIYEHYAKQHPTSIIVFYNQNSAISAGIVREGIDQEMDLILSSIKLQSSAQEEDAMEYFLCFKAPAVLMARGYDWIWRFSDHTELLHPVRFNVFDRMIQQKKRFAYAEVIKTTPGSRFESLWNIADKICSVRECSPAFSSWDRLSVIVTSFSIGQSATFSTSAACRALLEAATLNWAYSESELRTVCIMMSLSFEEQWRIDDILYNSRWSHEDDDADSTFQALPQRQLDLSFMPQRFGWLGGDIATSVPLPSKASDFNGSPGKLVWLFGDSIVGSSNRRQRLLNGHFMIANSVAITTLAPQEACLATVKNMSKIRYYWKHNSEGLPSAVFEVLDPSNGTCSHGSSKLWPISGLAIIDDAHSVKLVLLCVVACPNHAGYGAFTNLFDFEVVNSAVIVVHNPFDSPDDWVFDYTVMPDSLHGKVSL